MGSCILADASLALLRPQPPTGPGPMSRRPLRVSSTAPTPNMESGAAAASAAAAAVHERARSVEAEQRRRDDESAENALRRVDRLTQRGRASARGRLAQTAAMARVAARQAISGAFYAVAQVAGGFHVGCACVGATRITLVCETPVFCFLLFCRRWLSRRSQDGFLLSRGLARLCGASRAAAISF